MRSKLLKTIAAAAERMPGRVLLVVLVITVVFAALSENLKLEMHFKNLMPQNHPMVTEYDRIIDDYSTASMIIVAARGDESELKSFADELAPKIRAMKNDIRRVEVKIDTAFIADHGFMLQKAKDLKNMQEIYRDLNIIPFLTELNTSFEKTYVQDDESISTKEKENEAVNSLDGIQFFISSLRDYINGKAIPGQSEIAADRFLLGDPYTISPDKDMLLLFAQPNFTINELDRVIDVENKVDSLIAVTASAYPSIDAGTTGTMALSRDETKAANEDMYLTSLIAFVLILALFIISFRMWVAPLLAGITLIIGIIWTAGFAAIAIGSLNIMTSMFAVILLGLGVDFSIHIISVYTEQRAEGDNIGTALNNCLQKSGPGIITGAFTTAAAFYTLMISETAGMREFGLLAGSGVLFCMLATLIILPAMLALRDKLLVKLRKDKYKAQARLFPFLGKSALIISNHRPAFLTAIVVVTAGMFYLTMQITFDYNYLNMEPVGLTSVRLQHEMEKEFDATPDFAMVTAESVEDARHISEKAKDLKMLGIVTSISEYVPSPDQQSKRRVHIEQIKQYLQHQPDYRNLKAKDYEALMEQIYRLQDNVIELAQLAFLGGQKKVDAKCASIAGDPENPDDQGLFGKLISTMEKDKKQAIAGVNSFYSGFRPVVYKLARRMANSDPITVDDLPQNIRDQFLSKDGTKSLVTMYPKQSVWNLAFLKRFTDRMENLDQRVTGMPLVFYVLIQKIAVDGRNAALLTILVIFLILMWDFRRFGFSVLALLPLLVGAIWMIGTMFLTGQQLTMLNLMGLPLILGIGIDDGVHVLHRYKYEQGKNIEAVFNSTGKAVLLTSITTMLAFGSLVFATYRGLGSLGSALFIGVGTSFLATILVLPVLIGFLTKNSKHAGE